MSEHAGLVRAMDGKLIGWETGPPQRRHLLRQMGRLPRFAGATREPFTVLQHSLHVARLLEAAGHGRGIIAAGMMHDAAEVLTGDVPTPFKPPEWREQERAWVERAAAEYGLGIDWAEAWPLVHAADRVALHIEGRALMPAGDWKPEAPWQLVLDPMLAMTGHQVEIEAAEILSRARVVVEMAQHKDWGPLDLPPAVAVGAPVEAEDEGRRCPECGREVEQSRRDGMLHLQCPERAVCGWAAFACEAEGCAGLLSRFSTRVEKVVHGCNVDGSHPEFPEAATAPVPLPPAPQVCTWDGCQGTVALMGGQWRCSYSQAHKVPGYDQSAEDAALDETRPCAALGCGGIMKRESYGRRMRWMCDRGGVLPAAREFDHGHAQ